ncbi:T9SS type A sorting domain-containing protein [Hymenobacter tibetensis]|uniref:T9SS type A sorting domain-containing protein n=1 Tax=Hymenobacter tibetensis TaxID=497967 RepID=A0ABY4D7R2_9BACT|nr:T9SS type A sorting domain-containing protein [Hymenobacter tibetensis]UOG76028.1 T9SS type A sorting domain-containing protein [Hymenobacter tibetensis]
MKLLLNGGQLQHDRHASTDKAHRGINADITVPGRAVEHNWNSNTNRWQDGRIVTYTYDARGNTSQIVSTDSVSSQPLSRELYAYNLRKQITEETYQTWAGSAYVNEERYQYTYDAQGNFTLQIGQIWSGTAWTTRSGYRFTNTYNTANVLTSRTAEQLNTSTGVWGPDRRIIYTVDANNQWAEVVYQEWENGAYVNDGRTRNITWYNWANLLPSYLEDQEWNGSTWVDDQRSTIVYQSNGSYVETQQKFTAPSTWVNDDRITETYDDFGNLILDQGESWNNNAWAISYSDRTLLSYTATNQVRRAVEQEYDTSLRLYVNSILTSYGNFVTLATRRATGLEATTSLYPNPASSAALLYVPGMRSQGAVPAEVLNTMGQVVRTFVLQPQQGSIRQELNLEGLAGGVYTIRLHPTEGTIAKRIVKQ